MCTFTELLRTCNEKIERWDGHAPMEFAETFNHQEIDAMMGWMSTDCPFDIDEDYFQSTERSSGYEIMRVEVITNYLRRNLMYMIDQTDTETADRWYCKWKNLYR